MAARRRGRGRLSAIDLLPSECDVIVAWAAQELSAMDRNQTDIFAEFRERLLALQGETGVAFDIPSFSAFNRYSTRLSTMSRRLEEARQIAASLSERLDAGASDDLTVIAGEAIKTLVFELLQSKGEAGISTKGAQELANALRAVAAAQKVSTTRRKEIEEEFAGRVEEAVDKVADEAGLSADQVAQIRKDVLGVRS